MKQISEAKIKRLADVEAKVAASRHTWERLGSLILKAWKVEPGRLKVALLYLQNDDRKIVECILKGDCLSARAWQPVSNTLRELSNRDC
jgi:hypothetical protein